MKQSSEAGRQPKPMTQALLERLLSDCCLCPRACHADRMAGARGVCGCDGKLRAARAALHTWEEPCISGGAGSGAVFFSGCGLRCVYCQNREIAQEGTGQALSIRRLGRIFLELQEQGAVNLNLVTPTHYVPHILLALQQAKEDGFSLPVVYNCGGYETVETLRLLEGWVDVYLPDLKYLRPESGARYSGAPDYPERAKAALEEMVRQRGAPVLGEDGLLRSGVLVRHLVLPGHVREASEIAAWLHARFGKAILLSLLRQYTPMEGAALPAELCRRVTSREYERVLQAALACGIEDGYMQEKSAAQACFIPDFSGEGIRQRQDGQETAQA